MSKFINTTLIIGIILILITPFILVQDMTKISENENCPEFISNILNKINWEYLSFNNTGQIGDTIGGTTAPIIGILSIILLVYTLREQIKFNQKQKEISIDEQFKTTFFSLLQVQRDIIDKISGKFTFLGYQTYEEHLWNKGKIEVTKKGKEFLTIQNGDNEVKGLEFFVAARYQLSQIFQALDSERYFNNYDAEEAYSAEVELQSSIFGGSPPPDIEEEQNKRIISTKAPFRIAYANDKYKISKNAFDKYKTLNDKKQIGFAYAFFFRKYEGVGYYFRHIYQILKFIKLTEDEKIKLLGRKVSKQDKVNIHNQFRQYAQFIQAQMSKEELCLLFYNSFTFEKAQNLIIHYDLLENLTIQNLIKKEHNCISELKLKDMNNMFLDLINE